MTSTLVPQMAKNYTGVFTQPTKILCFPSLPAFERALQTTELNQTATQQGVDHGNKLPLK